MYLDRNKKQQKLGVKSDRIDFGFSLEKKQNPTAHI